jgi:hypothetical protein
MNEIRRGNRIMGGKPIRLKALNIGVITSFVCQLVQI